MVVPAVGTCDNRERSVKVLGGEGGGLDDAVTIAGATLRSSRQLTSSEPREKEEEEGAVR